MSHWKDHLRNALGKGDLEGAMGLFAHHGGALSEDGHVLMKEIGNAFMNRGNLAAARRWYESALRKEPGFTDALYNLGNLFTAQGELEEAMARFKAVLDLDPRFWEAQVNLGLLLANQGQVEEARAHYEMALALHPRALEAQVNLAILHNHQGRLPDALAGYRKALDMAPNHPAILFSLSMLLLLQGDLQQGFALHEARLALPGYRPADVLKGAPWQGESLAGQSLLVYPEQGLGDMIQFARYLPLIKGRFAAQRVTVVCQGPLKPLLANIPGVDHVLADGEALPAPYDRHVSIMSLPWAMGTHRLEDIPPPLPLTWRAAHHPAIRAAQGRLKVGLAWAGSPSHVRDRERSIPWSSMAPLLNDAPDCAFFSLQVGTGRPPEGLPPQVVDLAGDMAHFGMTADLLLDLDLVIAVDTAVAHLAATLGLPVWLLVTHVPDWRWLLGRADSPWYEHIRLFRQEAPGDWAGVIKAVGAALADFGRG